MLKDNITSFQNLWNLFEMALNYEGFFIKEEPKEDNEDVTELSKLIPNFNVKLEDDAFLQDKPEFVNLQSSTNCYNGYEMEKDVFFDNITCIDENDKSVSKENEQSNYEIGKNTDVSLNVGDTVLEDISDAVPNSSQEGSDGMQDAAQTSSCEVGSDDSSSSDENDGESTCKVCKKVFIDEYELQLHYKSRRLLEKCYKCCGCEKMFRDNTQLNVHSRKHTGEQPYACKVCGKKFSVNGNLSKHMRIHTGERRYECDTCERKFTQFAHLEDHMKTHSGDRPFVCDFCNSAFKTKARLRKHRKSHEDDKVTKRSVPCPVCLKMMKSTKQLITHMETHDNGSNNPFPCNICGKSYKNLFYLNFHLKVHGGIKDFKCSLCDKAFANASHLRRHTNSHTGIRPFSCELCMRAFPSQQNLKRHMMTHTGEKPFSCQDCGKGFLTLENLNRHKRTHTGEKPFPCGICGKFFAHSTTAKEHQRIHTGDKPFGCSLCDKRFALNKALYKHIRERHPHFFPEFKKLNDLPPNMKRAREKIKKEAILYEETDIKNVNVTNNFATVTLSSNNASEVKNEIVKKWDSSDTEEMTNEIPFIKVEKQEYDCSSVGQENV